MATHTLPSAPAGVSDTRSEVALPDTGDLPAWFLPGPAIAPFPDELVLTADEEFHGPAVERMQAYFAAIGAPMLPCVETGVVVGWLLDRRTPGTPSPSFFRTPGEIWAWWRQTAGDHCYMEDVVRMVARHFRTADTAERRLMRRWVACSLDINGRSGWKDEFRALKNQCGIVFTPVPKLGWSTQMANWDIQGFKGVDQFIKCMTALFDDWEQTELVAALDAACSPADFCHDKRRL
jgi:hypothetical protein